MSGFAGPVPRRGCIAARGPATARESRATIGSTRSQGRCPPRQCRTRTGSRPVSAAGVAVQLCCHRALRIVSCAPVLLGCSALGAAMARSPALARGFWPCLWRSPDPGPAARPGRSWLGCGAGSIRCAINRSTLSASIAVAPVTTQHARQRIDICAIDYSPVNRPGAM